MVKISASVPLDKPVFFDHDGGIDDFVSLILLLSLKNVRLTGISIVNGDCLIEEAVETTSRILHKFGRTDVGIAKGCAEAVHPFPYAWREKSSLANQLNDLAFPSDTKCNNLTSLEASEFMTQKIMAETEKSTLLMTGPASNVAKAIKIHPEIKNKIERIVWMAGAIDHSGNVSQPSYNGSAEWNVFWDPISAQELIRSGIPLILFPIDVCSHVPVDTSFMSKLEMLAGEHEMCQLVYRLYQIVHLHENYYMWDVLPSAYLGMEDLMEIKKTSIDVELQGPSCGRTYKSPQGTTVQYATSVKKEQFYDFLFGQLANWK